MIWARVAGGVLIAVGVCGLPFLYKADRSVEYRNLRVVEPGVLYRSGMLTESGFDRVFREQGIRTVVTFRDNRDDGKEPEDEYEAALCRTYGIAHYRLPRADWSPDPTGTIPGDRNMNRFIELLADPTTQYPMLVHCFAGIHRTGPYCAVYRMEKHGWTHEQAIDELRGMGTVRTTFSDNLMTYLNDYRPVRLAAARKTAGR